MLSEITPLIITFNESANISRTLDRLAWARRIVVVDSYSTDETLAILRSYPQVQVVSRKFDSFDLQCNFGLEHVQTPWVLSLDADYILGEGFAEELEQLECTAAGYRASFRYCVNGVPLRASLYPPRTVLYRRDKAHYESEGHGHRVVVDGPVLPLRSKVDHDDRKPLSRWLASQIAYSEQEARHLLATPISALNHADKIRRGMLFAPALVFCYTMFFQGLILDGLAGWHYAFQRTIAEMVLSLQLLNQRVQHDPS